MTKRHDLLFADVPIIDDEGFIQGTFVNRDRDTVDEQEWLIMEHA